MAKKPNVKKLTQQSLLGDLAERADTILEADTQSPQVDLDYQLDPETAAMEADYDKYDKPLEAAAAGVLRGAVPASDVILTKGFGVSPETLEGLERTNPVASGVGEAAGFVGSAIGSGGTSVAGKLTLGGAALATEKALAKSIGKSFANQAEKKIARQIIEKGAIAGAAGLLPGAALGINELANENALGKADLTAENMLAYAGIGAAINGLAGGAFGAMEAAVPAVKIGVDKASGQLKKTFNKTFDVKRNAADLVSSTPSEASRIFKSFEDNAISDKELGDFFKNDLKTERFSNADDMFQAYKKNSEDIMNTLTNTYTKMDEVVPGGAISSADLDSRLYKKSLDMAEKYKELLDTPANRASFRSFQKDLANRSERTFWNSGADASDTFSSLWSLQKKFDTLSKYDAKDQFKSRLYKDMSQEMRALREELVDNIAQRNPVIQEINSELKALNRRSVISKTIGSALENKVSKPASDFITQSEALLAGVGALAADPFTASAVIAGKKFMNSDLKRRFVVLNTGWKANQESAKKISEVLKTIASKSIAGAAKVGSVGARKVFLDSGFAMQYEAGKRPKAPTSDKEAFKNFKTNLTAMSSNPEILANSLAKNFMKLNIEAPNISANAQMTAATAVNFLMSKMPRNPNADLDVINKGEWQPSSMQTAQFQRYVQAVEHPFSLMEDLATGLATQEQVEAVSTVYPALYTEIKMSVAPLLNQDSKLSYNKKLSIAKLLRVPLDYSMQPASIASLQYSFISEEQQEQSGAVKPTVGGMSKLGSAERTATETQKFNSGQE